MKIEIYLFGMKYGATDRLIRAKLHSLFAENEIKEHKGYDNSSFKVSTKRYIFCEACGLIAEMDRADLMSMCAIITDGRLCGISGTQVKRLDLRPASSPSSS